MAYSTPRTWTTGDSVTAAMLNQEIRDNVAFLANRPACRCTQSGNISCADNALTLITWNGETFDTDTMHDAVTNTGRITVKTAGIYVLTFQFRMAPEATTTWVEARIKYNGSSYVASQVPNYNGASFQPSGMVQAIYKAAVNDYFEAVMYQDNTANVAVNLYGNDANGASSFSAFWVGLG